MSSLLVVAPAPVIRRGDRLELDAKFAEGMALYAALWGGPVSPSRFESLALRRQYRLFYAGMN